MTNPGFMIPLNLADFDQPFEGGNRDICSLANQQTYTKAPWWTSENIQLTAGGNVVPSAEVGTPYVIEVGIGGTPGAPTTFGCVQNVQAWVCFPNTVVGGASPTLIVPSMQNNQFASYSDTNGPIIYTGAEVTDYQNPTGDWHTFSLSPWTPSKEDLLEEGAGHVCIIANAAGQVSLEDAGDPTSGIPAGVVITDQSQLTTDFGICQSFYQAQRNTLIAPAGPGGMRGIPGGATHFAFLAGAPERDYPARTTVAVTALDQGAHVDPVLLNVLSGGPYAGLSLRPAAGPPKSLRLARHDLHHHCWLAKLIHEAEEIVEELLGLDKHPFGGGHQLKLNLPPKGLQPLRVACELDPGEAPGTVHAIDITQTDANGARGGIRAGIVVVP